IPFNGLGVASAAGLEAVLSGRWEGDARGLSACLTTDRLLADAGWARLVLELIGEVIRGARALGFDLPEDLAQTQIARTRTMGDYKPSTLIDFERQQALELEALFLEPLRRALKAGVAGPRLEALCRVLQQLDAASSEGRKELTRSCIR
ncbi:MAG: ketopantoate reductase C-terminal domain-containing protein, partial [Limisphaerales bacterium]